MSSGLLPPVPDLIPIAALRKTPPCNNNSSGDGARDCVPCASSRRSEVMGEQRSRRRSGNQPAAELIDSAGSRGCSAAPQAPQSRKARSERHRKSDRRRGHRKPARTRSDSKHSRSRETSTPNSSPERPANPRVNPIFVWIRQEDTRIVDVKCEDYDKRNRILLTKTAQGWRAIPRTETLVPSLKEEVNRDQQQNQPSPSPPPPQQHHHHHHRNRKSRKSKVRRRSTGVQVDSDLGQDENELPEPEPEPEEQEHEEQEPDVQVQASPPWMSNDNVNVESLLPSHTIKRSTSPERSPQRDTTNVNSAVTETAQTPSNKCSADNICDVSPLDNLLAVAELEFNHQIQSGEWNKSPSSSRPDNEVNDEANIAYDKSFHDVDVDVDEDVDHKEFMKNLEQLNQLIETEEKNLEMHEDFHTGTQKTEECDYTEDDDNNLAMDDILSRLEQSLRSPESMEQLNNCDTSFEAKNEEENIKNVDSYSSDDNFKSVPEFETFFEETEAKVEESKTDTANVEKAQEKPEIIDLVESSTVDDEEPTDLSVKPNLDTVSDNVCDGNEEPTDLTVPKTSTSRSSTPRPPSQNSEAIQSPQPSGIPAVPPSPDIVSTTATNNSKTKSVFLESLLSSSSKKIALNSEVTIIRQKEPLDLGKCRKSASPTVTCSEEINNAADMEPPTKKFKSIDITLKNLLDADVQKAASDVKTPEKSIAAETPRLLELLKSDSEPDPLVQLKQLLADPNITVPDPMLVPKEKFSLILTRPGVEIPKLLKERPELRLPEALAFPHIMQDPNMLVLNIHHLESILSNKAAQFLEHADKCNTEKPAEKGAKKADKLAAEATRESPNTCAKKKTSENTSKAATSTETQGKSFNELASDIDAATQAAFSQMMWLPYLNHLEAMSLGSNSEIMKMLANSLQYFPFYPGQMPEFPHMFANRFPSPAGFPLQSPMNYGNAAEMNMWQEAMLQANMLRNKNTFDNANNKASFREYLEKINVSQAKKPPTPSHNQRLHMANKPPSFPNHFYPSSSNSHSAYQNPYMNMNMQNYQANSTKPNLQVPQYNPMSHQKSAMSPTRREQKQLGYPQQKHLSHYRQQNLESSQNFGNFYSQLTDQEKHQYLQSLSASSQEHSQFQQNHQQNHQRKEKPKVACKSFASVSHTNHKSHHEQPKEKSGGDFCRQPTSQPIDLSGSTTPGGKLKVKQHLIDPVNTPKLLKHHDDVPEVGSTTASIEEMQDAHKHLWHPLFGNQKGYSSPWNWTTVTATGE